MKLTVTAKISFAFTLIFSNVLCATQFNPSQRIERLELKGIVAFDDELMFSLHLPQENSSFWISINQPKYGIEVVKYDQNSRSITVIGTELGTTHEIKLKDADGTPLPTPGVQPHSINKSTEKPKKFRRPAERK